MLITNSIINDYSNTLRAHNDHLILYGLTEENAIQVINLLPDSFFKNQANYIFIGYMDSAEIINMYLRRREYQGKLYPLAPDISLDFLEFHKATYQLTQCIMQLILKVNHQELTQLQQQMVVLSRYHQHIIEAQQEQIAGLQRQIDILTPPRTLRENTLASNPFILHAPSQTNNNSTEPNPGSIAYILNK